MRNDKPDLPRTMENCFADGKCDNCGAHFTGRTEIWVWCEHTCCSKSCVLKAKRAGDDEFLNKDNGTHKNVTIFVDEMPDRDLL